MKVPWKWPMMAIVSTFSGRVEEREKRVRRVFVGWTFYRNTQNRWHVTVTNIVKKGFASFEFYCATTFYFLSHCLSLVLTNDARKYKQKCEIPYKLFNRNSCVCACAYWLDLQVITIACVPNVFDLFACRHIWQPRICGRGGLGRRTCHAKLSEQKLLSLLWKQKWGLLLFALYFWVVWMCC